MYKEVFYVCVVYFFKNGYGGFRRIGNCDPRTIQSTVRKRSFPLVRKRPQFLLNKHLVKAEFLLRVLSNR